MKLVEVVEQINEIDEDQIIFQENPEVYDSDIILEYGDETDSEIKNLMEGISISYEVSLAKNLLKIGKKDWIISPQAIETAKRLHHYAKFDA